MILAPMRFKDYVWPHNPRVYEIEYKRQVVTHKVPFGVYTLQSLGRSNRVLRGEGEFAGEGAYDEFKKLATVFYGNTPGLLVHPVWQVAEAFFVALRLRQEPREDYVSYEFEFWECYSGYESGATQINAAGSGGSSSAASAGTEAVSVNEERKAYTVVYGDSLWSIASANGLSLSELLAKNPQIKNPNLIYPGDEITVA